MKITQQIRLTIAALAVVGVGAAVIELYGLQKPVEDARILKEVGLLRGDAEHAVELEVSGEKSDSELAKVDAQIKALIEGDPQVGLPKAKGEFLTIMQKVQKDWEILKQDVLEFRTNPAAKTQLNKDNEIFYKVTTEAVDEAENIFQEDIAEERLVIIGILITELLLVAFAFVMTQRATTALKETVNGVTGSSSQIAATVDEQGRIVSDQTASVNETTTTIEELGASSLQAAQQADASAKSAQQALDTSETGRQTVQETLDGIAGLRTKVGEIAEKIMQLSEETDQISTISKLVADVADQTNMLALNAAVEAARAGEQGKGFAVVAGEIRKLADQSRNSADKIGALVGTIQSSINSTVMVTDEGNKTADVGIQLAERTMSMFQEIATSINEVSIASQQIALSSKQQAVGVQQAVSAMNAINLGAKETATVVSQVKASTEELTDVANQLQVAV
ncbi:methyl-accepting chemotaxis protein [Acaryochloris sp. IP29b_bin.148]|uniref:methyl-accepting chemotaxis protein n=1 Tax=Acaryochloris sp. IP29b_bin.148 TaxID=2969218 RepID=UPI00260AF275|nr:methyl-accepting chemotaxis protein [Acaryochloris sp. IP29b_bin.148]